MTQAALQPAPETPLAAAPHAAQEPWGVYAPGPMARRFIETSRSSPKGSGLARRIVQAMGARPYDVETFGAKTRLHPYDNLADKRVLFAPQRWDAEERRALAEAAHPHFHFLDVGANSGLYSLYVAQVAGPCARILAVEPQPGMKERLAFNISVNGLGQIAHADVAVAEGPGTARLAVAKRNRGETGLVRGERQGAGDAVEVPTTSLMDLLDVHEFARVDAMKIDIEGAEDRALPPFFRDCPPDRLPHVLIMETRAKDWTVDCVALARETGYVDLTQTSGNIVLRRRPRA